MFRNVFKILTAESFTGGRAENPSCCLNRSRHEDDILLDQAQLQLGVGELKPGVHVLPHVLPDPRFRFVPSDGQRAVDDYKCTGTWPTPQPPSGDRVSRNCRLEIFLWAGKIRMRAERRTPQVEHHSLGRSNHWDIVPFGCYASRQPEEARVLALNPIDERRGAWHH